MLHTNAIFSIFAQSPAIEKIASIKHVTSSYICMYVTTYMVLYYYYNFIWSVIMMFKICVYIYTQKSTIDWHG